MQNFSFFVRPEPNVVYKDKLHKVNVWIMRAILLVAFAFSDFYSVNVTIMETALSGALINFRPEFLYPAVHILSGALSVLFFEIIGSLYYSLIRPLCPPVQLTKKGFMSYLRFTYVLISLLGGCIKLIYLFSDLYFYVFNDLIDVVVTTIGLIVLYAYINKHYVPDTIKSKFIKLAFIPYLAVQFVRVLGLLL